MPSESFRTPDIARPSDHPSLVSLREGTRTKHHYLICGVQGDFTRCLVNDPPTHLWTRQLKVSSL